MADKPSDLVQGTLDMLILKMLALEPMHGYGITVRLEQMSKGVFRLNAGSLFVAFQRLQRAGLITSEWKATENSRRNVLRPNRPGTKEAQQRNPRMGKASGGNRQNLRGIVRETCPCSET
jgi:DNA-binding PadR family transcriptional regulator